MLALSRRSLIAAGICAPLLALPGCATGLGGFGLEDAIRRILTLSSQRAFTRLLVEDGFFADDVARIPLPQELGGSRVAAALSVILGSGVVQDRLLRLVNRAARDGAEAAAPVVADSIRSMSISDAVGIVRGGPQAATDYLENVMGDAIVRAIFPGVGRALSTLENGLVNRALRAATGIDFAELQTHVASSAARGIYRAMGREEAAIRANPRETGDPLLIGVFGVVG